MRRFCEYVFPTQAIEMFIQVKWVGGGERRGMNGSEGGNEGISRGWRQNGKETERR